VHGLGFAAALGEVRLTGRAFALAPASFSVGVEVGQLAVAAAVVPLLLLARRGALAERLPRLGLGSAAVALLAPPGSPSASPAGELSGRPARRLGPRLSSTLRAAGDSRIKFFGEQTRFLQRDRTFRTERTRSPAAAGPGRSNLAASRGTPEPPVNARAIRARTRTRRRPCGSAGSPRRAGEAE
jgi:hypothetical protein